MIDKNKIKTFVICLEKKRKERCDKTFPKIKELLPKSQEFRAIEPTNIDYSDKNIVHPFAQYTIKHKMNHDTRFVNAKGTVGCSLSHINLWKKCIELNEPIIIIEDDVKLNKKYNKRIKNILENVPENSDFIPIIFTTRSELFSFNKQEKYDKYFNKCDFFTGCQMYYITPNAAKIFLENVLPIFQAIDYYMSDIINNPNNNIISYIPRKRVISLFSICKGFFNSTIDNDNINIKSLLPIQNMFYITILLLIIILSILLIRKNKKIN